MIIITEMITAIIIHRLNNNYEKFMIQHYDKYI